MTKPKLEQFKYRRRYGATPRNLPRKVDWRPILKAAAINHFNQGSQGSCTANTACIDKAFQEVLRGTYPGPFSRAFVYYRERELHGWENEDNGAYMEDEGTILGTVGVCLDTTMPYNQFDYQTNPDDVPGANEEAKDWTTDRDQTRLSWGDEMMAALNEGPIMVDFEDYGPVPDGLPRVGIAIYSSFWNSEYNGGYVPIPKKSEALQGGHSIWCVGYDLDMVGPDGTEGYFIFWGSWGELICAQGDHYIPIDYHREVGDDSDTWKQFDQTPGPGPGPNPPEPTDCYSQDLQCQQDVMNGTTDFWEMFWGKLGCMETFFICYLGVDTLHVRINKALGKKASVTKKTTLKKIGINVSVTISKPKKASW